MVNNLLEWNSGRNMDFLIKKMKLLVCDKKKIYFLLQLIFNLSSTIFKLISKHNKFKDFFIFLLVQNR